MKGTCLKATQLRLHAGFLILLGLVISAGRVMAIDITADPSFRPALNGEVTAAAQQRDGKLLVAGKFDHLGNMPVGQLIRLQLDGTLDTTFQGGLISSNATEIIQVVAENSDGTIIVAGTFTALNGQSRDGLARLDAAGNLDPDYGVGTFHGIVCTGGHGNACIIEQIQEQPDGSQLVLANDSVPFGAQYINTTWHLLTNGILDTNYVSPSLSPLFPRQSDGKVLSWRFASVINRDTSISLQRYFPNGTLDASYQPTWQDLQTRLSDDFSILAVTVDANDRALVASQTSFPATGLISNQVARLLLSGTRDTSFPPIGFDGVSTLFQFKGKRPVLLTLRDGSLLLGGAFTNAANASTGASFSANPRLTRFLLSDAQGVARVTKLSLPAAVNVGATLTLQVDAAGVQPYQFQWDFAGQAISGATNRTLTLTNIQISQAGSYHVTISNALGIVTSDPVVITVQAQPSGTVDSGFAVTGVDGSVNVMTLQPDGKVLIGGTFTNAGGLPRNRIARLNADGSLDATFDPGAGANNTIDAVALQPDGKILVGGVYSNFDAVARLGLARLVPGGAVDTSFNPATNFIPQFFDYKRLMVLPGGKILVGGKFVFGTNNAFNSLARLLPDGSLDSSPKIFLGGAGSFFNFRIGNVNDFALLPDGGLLAAGFLSRVDPGAVSTNGGCFRMLAGDQLDASFNSPMAWWNDPSDPLQPKFPAEIIAVAVLPDGGAFIAGNQFSTGGQPLRRTLYHIKPDGSVNEDFLCVVDVNPAAQDFPVRCLAVQPDGKLVIGGAFTSLNGTGRTNLARLNFDGSVDLGFDPGAGPDGVVRALTLDANGNIVIGGDFTSVNGVASSHVARLGGGPQIVLPRLTITHGSGSAINVTVTTAAGTAYTLEQRAASGSGVWTTVRQFTGDGAVKNIADTVDSTTDRFYRVRVRSN
ncbi:MAG TPA: hypothetical protein VHH73_03975 [Verrucomicrobiae bacterium]|nr:hypothetical protein [Verrucomicrobiae bacterium]